MRYVVEPLSDQFVIRDTVTSHLVLDGIIPLMRSTREAAEKEASWLNEKLTSEVS